MVSRERGQIQRHFGANEPPLESLTQVLLTTHRIYEDLQATGEGYKRYVNRRSRSEALTNEQAMRAKFEASRRQKE
ncbi:hypothetical protein DES52_11685 [Deinococcus yavapaiensis KR-236]|uniref:Uncharacterized protein n=1 Tax=Deinococcus yavapaiensis KR-236 TaxID=694435 RepID=A0A318SE33_9DEIO|nr:hypothetical protein DES52_11685 [Deinococcus yavapaiensis KR-236]